jgi:hypothetical protein
MFGAAIYPPAYNSNGSNYTLHMRENIWLAMAWHKP